MIIAKLWKIAIHMYISKKKYEQCLLKSHKYIYEENIIIQIILNEYYLVIIIPLKTEWKFWKVNKNKAQYILYNIMKINNFTWFKPI